MDVEDEEAAAAEDPSAPGSLYSQLDSHTQSIVKPFLTTRFTVPQKRHDEHGEAEPGSAEQYLSEQYLASGSPSMLQPSSLPPAHSAPSAPAAGTPKRAACMFLGLICVSAAGSPAGALARCDLW